MTQPNDCAFYSYWPWARHNNLQNPSTDTEGDSQAVSTVAAIKNLSDALHTATIQAAERNRILKRLTADVKSLRGELEERGRACEQTRTRAVIAEQQLAEIVAERDQLLRRVETLNKLHKSRKNKN